MKVEKEKKQEKRKIKKEKVNKPIHTCTSLVAKNYNGKGLLQHFQIRTVLDLLREFS